MKTVRIKKNMLGLVLAAAMLMLTAPCAAFASTPPSVTLGELTDLTGSGYYSFSKAEATNGNDDGTEVKPTTLTISVSGAGTIVGLNDQGHRDASKTSLIVQVADASEVQEHLRYDISFYGCDTTTKIEVTVSADATSLPEETASITKVVDGHCYMYVNRKLSWSAAYNAAKTYTYNGMRGYLATFSTDSEYDTLRSRVSTSGGWIGGTLMRKSGGDKIADDNKLTREAGVFVYKDGAAYDNTKATALPDYYWACGPGAGSAVDIDTHSDDEPNAYQHSGADSDRPWEGMDNTLGMTLYESCLLANHDGSQDISDITESGYQADGYADGFFVEFGGYDKGKDPGTPDSNKTSTVTWTHTHELQYSAGTNKLTVKCTNDNGYCSIPKDGLTLTIPGTMTINPKKVVYQGTVEVVGTESERAAWTAAGVDLPTDVSIEYSKTEDGTYAPIEQARNVGYYKISLTAGGVTVQATWEVFPASCVVWKPKVKDKVYDGTTTGEIDDSATEIDGIIKGDDLHVTGTCTFESAGADDNNNKDVTVTNLVLTGDDADNYELGKWTEEYDPEARITRRPVKLTWSNLSFDYDGQEHVPSCTAGNLVGDDTVSVTVSGGQTNAGTWTAAAESLTGTNATNYKLPDEHTKDFTIVGTSINPEVSIAGWTYGDEASVPTVAGNPGGGAVTYEYSEKGKENWSTSVPTNAGEYTVRATVAAAGNYESGTATADFTISPRVASLDWGFTELAYNGSEQAPTCTVSNKVAGDDVTVKVTGGKRDAGKGYTAKAASFEGTAAGNYVLPSTGVTKGFAIAPLTVELAWGDAQFTYNGSEQAPACSVTNAVGDDKVAVSVSGAKRDAGEWTATASSLTGTAAGNYALPSTGATKDFTIAPLTAELAWGFTEFTYNGKAQAPTCTVANALAGDDVKVTVDGAQTDAGDYTATAQALTGTAKGNYALPEQKTTAFSIAKAAITPAVSIKGWTYGDAAVAPSVDADGNPGSATVTYVYSEKDEESWSEVAPSAVGEYTVKATVPETKNYQSGTATADFSIAQRKVTLAWDETPLVYNGSAQVPACTLGNTVEGDAVNVVVTGSQVDAGEGYEATATLEGDDRNSYVLPEVTSKAFSIEKASITPTVSIEGWTYGDEANVPSIDEATNPGGGAVTYEYAARSDEGALSEDGWSTEAPTAAGDYTVRATVAATANYKGAVATADFTIAPKSIEGAAVVLGPSLTENGKEQEQTVESVTLSDGTVLTVDDFTVSGSKVTSAGTYKLTVTGAGNYTGSVEAEFTVAANSDVKPDDEGDDEGGSDEDKPDKGDTDKKGSGKKDSKKKIPGTGDDSAAIVAAVAAAGIAIAAVGVATRRRTAA